MKNLLPKIEMARRFCGRIGFALNPVTKSFQVRRQYHNICPAILGYKGWSHWDIEPEETTNAALWPWHVRWPELRSCTRQMRRQVRLLVSKHVLNHFLPNANFCIRVDALNLLSCAQASPACIPLTMSMTRWCMHICMQLADLFLFFEIGTVSPILFPKTTISCIIKKKEAQPRGVTTRRVFFFIKKKIYINIWVEDDLNLNGWDAWLHLPPQPVELDIDSLRST